MNLQQILAQAILFEASDIHLSAGINPQARIKGEICSLAEQKLSDSQLEQMLFAIIDQQQKADLVEKLELDFAYPFDAKTRLRVNVFYQNRGIAAVFRLIPTEIKSLEELNAPAVLQDFANLDQGLVLITGPTGSGKSTTLAAIISQINQQSAKHILTIEDPIEFIHQPAKSLINQREIQRDTLSFNNALKAALREDPDVILLGELRDLETIRLALTAAETGHLVFATLHTRSATSSLNRIIDVFPAEEKALVRSLIADSLQAVVSQKLVNHQGQRQALFEVLIANNPVRNLIREDKLPQIQSIMQTSSQLGMQTMEQAAQKLI